MTDQRTARPYAAQDHDEINNLVNVLDDHAVKGKHGGGGFTVKKKTFEVFNGRGAKVDSWQLQDWDYKKPNLPTYARGLFTHRHDNHAEIAVRGYDKFFNVGEVNKTQWRNIEQNTRGPYELSVKENGCIIFIAGLPDDILLVTSKHSTGARGDASANHSLAGDSWVDRQLKALGRTRTELAKTLRKMNATAVAELCDDDFEEHVLQYMPEAAGLYLHGINLNLPGFSTYSSAQVDVFAQEWGFRKVMYVVEHDIHVVKRFLDKVAETGNYAGRDTEGFVIRCQARETATSPWEDWFFKYKFEEPYLMYRQWREATKAIIAGREPKVRKHKQITIEYLNYARRRLAQDPQLGKLYNQNHGIIAMREGFLAEKGVKGSDIIQAEIENGTSHRPQDVTRDIVLVPVATIGCGKTTIAVALSKLFNWGHEQNDNITGKGGRPQRFANAVVKSLHAHPVVVADRNNHQRRERQQLINDVQKSMTEARFVALQYVHDRGNYDNIRKVTRERVLTRGDNHQTIQAGSKSQDEILGIMEGFLGRFEPVDAGDGPDAAFDAVVDLDATASSRENLETIVHQLHDEFPSLFRMPSDSDMDAAIASALDDYRPDIKHDLGKDKAHSAKPQKQNKPLTSQPNAKPSPSPKSPRMEYFSIALPLDRMTFILNAVFSNAEPPDVAAFYHKLRADKRVQPAFHVTLIHRASAVSHAPLWDRLNDDWRAAWASRGGAFAPGTDSGVSLGAQRVHLERVVWDGRVMCVVVRLPDAASERGYRCANRVPHVTVGTADASIKPKESNDLLERWEGGAGEEQGVRDVKVKGNVVLEGRVVGIVAR